MADYHIYLHSDFSTGNSSLAKPSNFRKQENEGKNVVPWQQYATFITNPDSLIGVAKQKAMTELNNAAKESDIAAKAVVAIGIVKAVVQILDNTATTTTQMFDLSDGGTRTRTYNNIKQPLQWIMNPVSTTMNALTTTMQIKRDEVRRELNVRLLGDSQLNANKRSV